MIDEQALAGLLDRKALDAFRKRALNPENPVTRGTAQNSDIYFQTREASNKFYNAITRHGGRRDEADQRDHRTRVQAVHLLRRPGCRKRHRSHGLRERNDQETIDYMRSKGEKAGLVTVHLYRPFSPKYLFDVLPASVKRICVLDRTKEPGANGEPLYLDIKEVFYGRENAPLIVGGRYGLSFEGHDPGPDAGRLREPEGQRAEGPLHGGHRRRRDFHLSARRTGAGISTTPTRSRPASSAWEPTARWAPTRTRSRSSATRPTNTASLLRVRLEEIGRLHGLALALRRQADPLALSGQHARLRGLPRFRRIWASTTCSRDSRTEARSCSTACGTPRRPRSICPMR